MTAVRVYSSPFVALSSSAGCLASTLTPGQGDLHAVRGEGQQVQHVLVLFCNFAFACEASKFIVLRLRLNAGAVTK